MDRSAEERPTGAPDDDRAPALSMALDAENRLLLELELDARSGALRPLAAYVERHPGLDGLVEREYERAHSSTSSGSLRDPLHVGPYQLLRRLGSGAQGNVYEARRQGATETCALKLLPPLAALDRTRRLRFRREAALLRRIEHPGLQRVRDSGVIADLPFVASDLVAGETLREWLERHDEARRRGGPLPALAAGLDLFEKLARALCALHEAGVVHRDVKPSNIVLTANAGPVLVDFGIAHSVDEGDEPLTASGDVLGTLAYVPPEQALGDARAWDPGSDVFSLGATMFEVLTLRVPDPRRSWAALAATHQPAAPDPRELRGEIPRDLALVVRTALAPDPAERYASMHELASELARVRAGRRVRVRRRRPLHRLIRWAARDPLLAGALGALLAVTLAAAGAAARWRDAERARLQQEERWAWTLEAGELVERSDDLWPVLPAGVPAMEAWIDEATDLLDGARGARGPTIASLAPGAPTRAVRRSLVAHLAELRARLEEVRGRRDQALAWGERTVADHQQAWSGARDRLRGDERFAIFELAPIPGLVPLGPDPHTGLEEFAHLLTGEPPARLPGSGQLAVTGATSVVLVLLPGGSFEMGAELPSRERPPGAPSADPLAVDGFCGPVHTVRLDPFLLSKFELTQGQWLRITGENPSRWTAGSDASIGPGHPVENITWTMARAALRRVGLVLPTEAQWEYGARAGTGTPWWAGEEREALRGRVNIADASTARAGHDWPTARDWPDLDDGFVRHAPAGALPPNGFGLHEVAGNVWEWCLDPGLSYDHPVRAGDGLRLGAAASRAFRGGGFSDPAYCIRSAHRDCALPDTRTFSRGVRPAMAVP